MDPLCLHPLSNPSTAMADEGDDKEIDPPPEKKLEADVTTTTPVATGQIDDLESVNDLESDEFFKRLLLGESYKDGDEIDFSKLEALCEANHSGYDSDDSDYFSMTGPDVNKKEDIEKYRAAVKASEGFDVPFFENVHILSMFAPADESMWDEVLDATQYAIDEQNVIDNTKKLTLVVKEEKGDEDDAKEGEKDGIKCTYRVDSSGVHMYVTFDATDEYTARTATYQTVVCDSHGSNRYLSLFREKQQQQQQTTTATMTEENSENSAIVDC